MSNAAAGGGKELVAELVAEFSASYTMNEEEFNNLYKEEHGHQPPPSEGLRK